MKKRHTTEMMERAEYLHCCRGYCLRTVAELTGVSSRVLKRWSVRYGWAGKRAEFGRALTSIKSNTIFLRQKLLEKSLEELDAGQAIAVLAMESRARKEDGEDNVSAAPLLSPDTPSKIENDQDAAAALESACRAAVKLLAADPSRMNISAVRALKEAIDLAEMLKNRGRPEKRGGLSDETARQIRMKILGLAE